MKPLILVILLVPALMLLGALAMQVRRVPIDVINRSSRGVYAYLIDGDGYPTRAREVPPGARTQINIDSDPEHCRVIVEKAPGGAKLAEIAVTREARSGDGYVVEYR